VRFLSQGLVHDVIRIWDINGQTFAPDAHSIDYLRSLGALNIACACGERTLWIKGQGKAFTNKEPLTCLACLVSP
jgi:hypothetical protein